VRGVKAPLLLFGPTLAAGMVGSVVSMNARGAEPRFVYDQQHPKAIEPGPLARAVMKGREPVASGNGPPGQRARCHPGSAGQLRNPWICTVVYPGGRTIRYRLRVNADGTFHGSDNQSDTIDGHLRSLIGSDVAQ